MAALMRIGGVRFLNARPLIYGLQQESPAGHELHLDVPSRLSDRLERGELDVALIPAVSYLVGVGERVVPGVSISCRGAVATVKLFCRVPPAELRRVAADRGSRTSVALARLLLGDRYGSHPEFVTHEPEPAAMLAAADAALVIGQASLLGPPPPGLAAVLDLGEEWWRWQRVPLTLAFWVTRPGLTGGVACLLQASRDRGLRRIESIVQAAAAEFGLPAEVVHDYLSRQLDYGFGPEHLEGYRRLGRLLAARGLVDQERELVFTEQ